MTTTRTSAHHDRPLIIDTRWFGVSGIGRFAREVVTRLAPGWTAMRGGSPSSAADVLNPHRLGASPRALVYSPGYNGGLSAARQLLTLHDLMHLREEASAARRSYYRHVIAPIVRRTGAVLTVSATSRRAIEGWLDDDRVRVVDVGNGISLLGDIHPPFHDSRERPSVLYVGNLTRHKGFDMVERVVAADPDLFLTVVSTDADEARARLEARGLAHRTEVMTNVSDRRLAALYAGASALIMPSTQEGFGLPAAEAMSRGTVPVVWRGCEALVEVTDGFGEYVDEYDDVSAWLSAVHAASARRIPPASIEHWRRRYQWDAVAGRVEKELQQLRAR